MRATLLRKPIEGVSLRWAKVGRWWGTGLNRRPMEIDIVAESADGSTLLVGEAKLALTKQEAKHVRAELEAKVEQLPFVARYQKVLTRLFVAEGGEFDCVDLSWVESNIEKSGSF